jgi:hypothetical protein
MRKNKSIIIGAGLLVYVPVVLCLFCGKTPGREIEPNDDFASAMTISPGKEVTGFLGTDRDVDFYKVFVSAPSVVSVSLSEVRGVNHSITCYDGATRALLMHVDDARKSSPEKVCNLHVSGGYLFIAVRHGEKDAPAANLDNPYVLTVDVRSPNPREEIEPNNTPDRATPVDVDSDVMGYFSPAFCRSEKDAEKLMPEEDWFSFEMQLPAGHLKVLDIDISPVEEVDSQIRLFSPAMKEIAVANGFGAGKGESLRGIGVSEGGKYYVVVSSVNLASNCQKPYTLSITSRAFDFRTEMEPNDSMDSAQIVQAEEISGSFISRDDRDWYVIKKGEGIHIARVEVLPAAGVDVAMNIYDASKKKIFEINAASAGAREVVPNVGYSDDLFLEIFPRALSPASGPHYKLIISTRPHAGGFEIEPNDSKQSATHVSGDTITGYTSKKGDIDYYFLEFPTRVRKKFIVSAVSGSKLKVSVTDPLGHIIRTVSIEGGREKKFYEIIDAKGFLMVKSLAEQYSEPYVIRMEDK